MKKLLITVLTMMLCSQVFAEEGLDYFLYKVLNLGEVELIYPNTFTSDHRDQCKPWCAEQNNGGHGLRWGRFGFVSLMNSFGDPGKVLYFEPVRYEYDFKYFRPGFAIWIMQIEGYAEEKRTDEYYIDGDGEERNVKAYEQIKVGPFPWAVFQFAISPIAIAEKISGEKIMRGDDKFWVKYNIIHFPVVRIQWWSMEFRITETAKWAYSLTFKVE